MLLKNIRSVLLASLLATLLSLLLNYFSPLVSSHWIYSLAGFAGLCFIFNLVYARQAGSESFSQLLLGGIVVKLLFALVVILLYRVKQPAGFFHFAIHFISHYILFTVFEIRYLLGLIKKNTTLTSHEN